MFFPAGKQNSQSESALYYQIRGHPIINVFYHIIPDLKTVFYGPRPEVPKIWRIKYASLDIMCTIK